jgi:hypothetical protein
MMRKTGAPAMSSEPGEGQTSEDGIVPPGRTPIDKAMVLRIG